MDAQSEITILESLICSRRLLHFRTVDGWTFVTDLGSGTTQSTPITLRSTGAKLSILRWWKNRYRQGATNECHSINYEFNNETLS